MCLDVWPCVCVCVCKILSQELVTEVNRRKVPVPQLQVQDLFVCEQVVNVYFIGLVPEREHATTLDHKTYGYIPFLEGPQQLCSTPQSKDTQMPHSVYCYCWQDREGKCHQLHMSLHYKLYIGKEKVREKGNQMGTEEQTDIPTHT